MVDCLYLVLSYKYWILYVENLSHSKVLAITPDSLKLVYHLKEAQKYLQNNFLIYFWFSRFIVTKKNGRQNKDKEPARKKRWWPKEKKIGHSRIQHKFHKPRIQNSQRLGKRRQRRGSPCWKTLPLQVFKCFDKSQL